MARPRTPNASSDAHADLGFLLSQVGAHVSSRFAERLAPLDLKPPHVGILGILEQADGLSQQVAGRETRRVPEPPRRVDRRARGRGLVERRDSPTDRRSYALHLTGAGRKTLGEIGRIASAHRDAICAALNESEQVQLAGFLRRIVAQQHLTPGVHPGFRKLGGPQDQDPSP